ncbi:SPBc2 prophage-derived glycosyltransferase SunS [compost metagenome]
MKTLALVMIVKNEEKVIRRCLDSVHKLVDEIIVLDTGSTDNTMAIVQSYGANVYKWTWNNNFADARNAALEHSTCDWNLILDADEYITNDCGETIRQFINKGKAIGRIKIVDQFRGSDGILSHAQNFISRLFPSNIRYEGSIHEQVVSDLPRIKIPVEIYHDGYMSPRFDRNIPILQAEIVKNPQDTYYHFQIAKEYRGLENHQLAYDHLSRAYSLIDRTDSYAPNIVVNLLYEIIATEKYEEGLPVINKEQHWLHSFADFHFVCGIFYMKLILSNTAKYIEFFPLIEESYLKCLQIGETDQYECVVGTGSFTALHNLGSLYEVKGEIDKAKQCYREAAVTYGYEPSAARLDLL